MICAMVQDRLMLAPGANLLHEYMGLSSEQLGVGGAV